MNCAPRKSMAKRSASPLSANRRAAARAMRRQRLDRLPTLPRTRFLFTEVSSRLVEPLSSLELISLLFVDECKSPGNQNQENEHRPAHEIQPGAIRNVLNKP